MTSPGAAAHRLTETDLCLLQAALGDGDQTIAGWNGFLSFAGGLDVLDAGQFRLLPQVYRNLKSHGHDTADSLGRLQGIYRQSWYRNRVAEARAVMAVSVLEAESIDVMVLKGMALVGLAYGDVGARPMNDVDLLIHGRDLRRAAGALERNGWSLVLNDRDEFAKFARLFHAALFRHETGNELDLHRHMLEESNWPFADEGLWRRSITTPLGGRQVRTLAPEDHLVHAIVHGTRWDPIPPTRWVVDAALLVRRHIMDWDLVVFESERRGVTLAVGSGLAFLRQHFEPSIPDDVPERLLWARQGLLERVDFRLQQAGRGPVAQAGRYVSRFLRLTSRKGPVTRARYFPLYLRAMWGLESVWAVPGDGLRRSWKRARGEEPMPRVRPIPD
jgi:hypothetical protein